MEAKLKHYQSLFDALPVRMRILFFIALVMLLLLIIDLLWLSPVANQIKKEQQQINNINLQVGELANKQMQLNQQLMAIKNSETQKLIKQVDSQIAALKSSLDKSTINLISPDEMVSILKSIIESFAKLKLVKLEKQPATPLELEGLNQSEGEQLPVRLYRHSLIIELEGNFHSTQKFLQAVENLPRRLQFDRFDYQVDRYPRAKISLQVSTLSLDKEWIGG